MLPTICSTASSSAGNSIANCGERGEIMLFGVKLVVDSIRKIVSMNNLSQYEQPRESNNNNKVGDKYKGEEYVTADYASADDVIPHSTKNRERKRGIPWTVEEHKLFLLGLQKVGKGNWRRISLYFVKTRTPTQVASHAQKYFLRQSNINRRRRRRSSLFDMTLDMVEDEQIQPQKNICFPDLNLNLNAVTEGPPLNLKLSLQSDQGDPSSSSRHSAFQVLPSFSNGDGTNIVTVA
ncbi:hypothetical protein E1A91_A03G092900v1 [Gossypium mustelinum]|uniref:Uncharacterized protein n=1 Tax=Gossypium mustelinum TaxID=34275 RepID=A0A5D2ZX11_GOSMU|nr:hypothetical protein E1A91_A03G092900v1 [Gossypium mustelinum]